MYTMYYIFLFFPEFDLFTSYLLGSSMLEKYKIIALSVLIYRASISHWPTNGDFLYRGMEILFAGRLCPLQFPGLFPFFVYFLFLCSLFSFFFYFCLRPPLSRSLRSSREIDVSASRYSRYPIF